MTNKMVFFNERRRLDLCYWEETKDFDSERNNIGFLSICIGLFTPMQISYCIVEYEV